jgi:hypothetical protein
MSTLNRITGANFKIESMKLQGQGPWSVPKSALIKTRDEVAVFRMRDGKYLRVSVSVTGKAPNQQIKGKDLKTGDEIVSKGGGFLRVAEIDVTSGEVGHHH